MAHLAQRPPEENNIMEPHDTNLAHPIRPNHPTCNHLPILLDNATIRRMGMDQPTTFPTNPAIHRHRHPKLKNIRQYAKPVRQQQPVIKKGRRASFRTENPENACRPLSTKYRRALAEQAITRIQFVSATLVFGLAAFDCSLAISSSHTSLGVLYPRSFMGVSLISPTIASSSSCVRSSKLVPLGR